MTARASGLYREQAPEPARFWVRYAPRRWPGPATPWLDLAAGTLGGEAEPDAGALERLRGARFADLLDLPPVPRELAPRRDSLAAHHAARGTPVLVQLLPGDPPPRVEGPLAVVWDLLPVALAGDPEGTAVAGGVAVPGEAVAGGAVPEEPGARSVPGALGRGAAAAWPLLPGAVGADRLARVAAEVAAAGIAALQGVAVELAPHQRRAIGSGLSERRYLALFHGEPADPGAPARAAWAAGLEPLLQRPLPRAPLHGGGGNLTLAAALATLGELCLRLGEPEPRGQALLRAARFAERLPQHLEALAREGNLGILPWLQGEPRAVVESLVAGEPPPLLAQLKG